MPNYAFEINPELYQIILHHLKFIFVGFACKSDQLILQKW